MNLRYLEDCEEADLGAKTLRVGGDGTRGVGGRGEQQVVDHCLVLIGDGGDFLRES